jgi:hypothetical protein
VQHQKDAGHEPAPGKVQDLVSGILERMDRKEADRKAQKPLNGTKKPGSLEQEFYRRGGTPGAFADHDLVKKELAPGEIRPKLLNLAKGDQKIAERIRLLKGKYDWFVKLAAVNPLAANGSLGPEKQTEANRAYWRVLLESEKVFGPIFADAPKKLMFT